MVPGIGIAWPVQRGLVESHPTNKHVIDRNLILVNELRAERHWHCPVGCHLVGW